MALMCVTALSTVNIFAVLVSSIAFFLLGSFWFSGLFGRMWCDELEKHGVVIKQPTAASLRLKMGLTFLGNFITALAMALLVHATASTTIQSALHLGLVVALGFVITAMGTCAVWVNKSPRLFLIDAGYPSVGIIISAIILSLWR